MFPKVSGPGRSFTTSPHPELIVPYKCHLLNPRSPLPWLYSEHEPVFPLSGVPSPPHFCYSSWLSSPRILCVQASSPYVSINTHKSCFSPDQRSLSSVSPSPSIFIDLLTTLGPSLYSSPLNSVLLRLSWFTFSILFSDFSALAGLMFSHYFLTLSCLFLSYTLDQIATMTCNICLHLFTYFYTFGLQC